MSKLIRMPLRIIVLTFFSDLLFARLKLGIDIIIPIPRYNKYIAPSSFRMKKALLFIFIINDESAILTHKCGMMPIVQPKAANMLALFPFVIPVEIVYVTPVPGINMMINDVIKKLNVFIITS